MVRLRIIQLQGFVGEKDNKSSFKPAFEKE